MTGQSNSPGATRSGFAIPAALLTILVLTVAIAAGFSIATAERRSADDQKAQITAFKIAEQGLETFLLKRDSLGFTSTPPGVKDSVRISFTDGYADVVMNRIRVTQKSVPGMYVVMSRGVQTAGAFAGTPLGVRTVAQYALWQPAAMKVKAGWSALGGLQKNGSSGTLTGIDACGDSATVAGVVVPPVPGYVGPTAPISGSPPVDSAVADSVPIDWNAIVNGTAISPNIIIPPASWPSFADTSYYPVIRVNGDITLPSSGRGTLIVTGSLTINGSTSWDGVLLVGGKLTSNGNNGINGTTISGLNVKLGQYVPTSTDSISTANGTKSFNYNSCSVARAMLSLGALIPIQNTWVDNWGTYP